MLSRSTFMTVLCTIFFPSHWLLSHTAIFEKMDSVGRVMNPVTMTIINLQKEYMFWLRQGSNQQHPVLKFCMLLTKLHRLRKNIPRLKTECCSVEKIWLLRRSKIAWEKNKMLITTKFSKTFSSWSLTLYLIRQF